MKFSLSIVRLYCCILVLFSLRSVSICLGQGTQSDAVISDDMRMVLDLMITAESLRGNLEFIASDLLEGRDTPSRGLELAAYYIAAQFQKAGLEPIDKMTKDLNGYFQTAHWKLLKHNTGDFKASIANTDGSEVLHLDSENVSLASTSSTSIGFDVADVKIFKIAYDDIAGLESLITSGDDLAGCVIITNLPDYRTAKNREERINAFRTIQAFSDVLKGKNIDFVLTVDFTNSTGTGLGTGTLINPNEPVFSNRGGGGGRGNRGAGAGEPMFIRLHGADIINLYNNLPAGLTDARLTLKLVPPHEEDVVIHNVAGVLRGSDPILRDSYIIVSAHYDHLGMSGAVIVSDPEQDNIYNGANDDGSGTVSVMEIAYAMSKLSNRPKRSILFMTYFGEEHGLLGSRYYADNPAIPLEKTVANLNLEMLGRTDDPDEDKDQAGRATFTGFEYSTMPQYFVQAGQALGLDVYNHKRNSRSFFFRSDNISLARKGIPAHTVCTTYGYAEYHGLTDHADKINYENMAKVDRMLMLGLYMLANDVEPPHWLGDNDDKENSEIGKQTEPFITAWQKLHNVDNDN